MMGSAVLAAIKSARDCELAFGRGVRLLFAATQGLPIKGWQVSCRISPNGVSTDRLLLGFSPRGVARARLAILPKALSMPAALAQEFQGGMGLATQILLAVESHVDGLEIRAYQSFKDAESGMRGFKWLEHDVAKTRIIDYRRVEKTWAEVEAFYQSRSGEPSSVALGLSAAAFAAAAQISRIAQQVYASTSDVEFLTVIERAGGGESGYVRLCDTRLRFTDIRQPIADLLHAYGLGAVLPNVIARMATRRLGWVAAGEDAARVPFVTVYGEASVLDGRRFMVMGAGT